VSVRIIAKHRLLDMAKSHGDCVDQVTRWYRTTSRETWRGLVDVRKTYRDTDSVGDRTVFNIKGNDYRLIVHINYATGIVYIKHLLTHAEYDRGTWKE